MNRKTVCVIGAGASGIVTLKQLIDEGHIPTCYEKSRDVGGIFHYVKGEAAGDENARGVYRNTVLTISNYLMCFSDMPPSGHRRHWHHSEYMAYLAAYVERFELRQYVQLESEILRVRPLAGGRDGYEVVVRGADGRRRTEKYDALAVCTGTHQKPNIPGIDGLERFKGAVWHSAQYDNPEIARDRDVLCVGLGESSADITREVADVARSCSLSLRSFPYLIPRNLDVSSSDSWTSRLHHDYFTSSNEGTLSYIALWLYFRFARGKLFGGKRPERDSFLQPVQNNMLDLDTPGDAECVKLIKAWNYLSKGRKFATKNVTFVPHVLSGKIRVNASGIRELTEDEVVFNDGERRRVDLLMLSTGYEENFDFIEGFQLGASGVREMFMNTVHPDLANCAFIGWARPVTGGIPACSEMAARYFSALLSGRASLPVDMRARIEADKEFYRTFYAKHSPRLHTVVAWKRHLETYSELIGCQVHTWKYLLRPKLFVRLFAGSLVPYQYRLEGRHAMPGEAERAICSLDITLPPEHVTYGIRMNLRNKIPWLRERALARKKDLEYSELFSEWFRFDVPLTVEDVKKYTFRRDGFERNFEELHA